MRRASSISPTFFISFFDSVYTVCFHANFLNVAEFTDLDFVVSGICVILGNTLNFQPWPTLTPHVNIWPDLSFLVWPTANAGTRYLYPAAAGQLHQALTRYSPLLLPGLHRYSLALGFLSLRQPPGSVPVQLPGSLLQALWPLQVKQCPNHSFLISYLRPRGPRQTSHPRLLAPSKTRPHTGPWPWSSGSSFRAGMLGGPWTIWWIPEERSSRTGGRKEFPPNLCQQIPIWLLFHNNLAEFLSLLIK